MDFLRAKDDPTVTEPKASAPECTPKIDAIDLGSIPFSSYMKAGYSLIHIRTEEDNRAIDMVKAVLTEESSYRNKVIYGEWRSTTGLLLAPERSIEIPASATSVAEGLADAIMYVGKAKKPHVVAYHNVRQFMTNFQILQSMKDAVYQAKTVGSHMILIGPGMDFPPEIQSMVTIYDLDLPNAAKFKDNFRCFVNAYQSMLTDQPSDRQLDIASKSAVGMTEMQGENAISLSIVMKKSVSPSVIQAEKEQSIKRSDVLEFVHARETINELGGFAQLKDWVRKRKDTFTPEATEFGLKFPKGILLVGIPGSGKSLAARCVAHYLELPLLKFDMGKVFKSLVGSSEQTIRAALKTAEAVAPVVLWIEEIEKSMAGSQSSGQSDSGTTARVMSTILTWMQENRKPIFLIATANNVEALPPELLRKGRFSEIWGVQEPNDLERHEIWGIHIGRVRADRKDKFDYSEIVKASEGYTGAEIEAIVEEAMFDAWDDGKREMTTDDILKAIKKFVPQTITCKEKIDVIKSWMSQRVRFVSASTPASIESTPTTDTWRKLRESAEVQTSSTAKVSGSVSVKKESRNSMN